MKKLILIRHAKSSWEFNTSDLKRPLSERGINDAEIMSKVLKNLSIEIDVVQCVLRDVRRQWLFFSGF